MKKIILCLAVILTVLIASFSPTHGNTPTVSVQGSPVPGGTLFVQVGLDENSNAGTVEFAEMTLPLQVEKGVGKTILPVPLDKKPGDYDLKITISGSSGDSAHHRVIPIKPKKYAVQYLTLPPSEEDKYEAPGVVAERAAIEHALKTVSKKYTWWGSFIWPVDAGISTEFGIKRYINGEDAGRHWGFDLPAPEGTPVKATNCGTVLLARSDFTLHGKTVIIDHGIGLTSLYIHLSSISVKPGDLVKRGQVIGRVGSTGVATGPHLHWGVYVGREAVDPRMFMHLPKSWQ